MIKILTSYDMTMILWCYSQNSEIYISILQLCKTNITCNFTSFPRTWRHTTFNFTVLFQTATFEMQRYLFSAYVTSFSACVTSFSAYHFPVLFKKKIHFHHNVFFTSFIIFLNFHFRPRIYFYYQYYSIL